MRRISQLLLLTSLASLAQAAAPLTAPATADRPPAACDSNPVGAALVRCLGDSLQAMADLPGFSIAALRGDRLVLAAGFGVSDMASGAPVLPSTQFLTASVAKVITATAALSLYEQQRFDLDKPARDYLPEIGASGDGITARLLAAHLSGLPHYGPGSMPPSGHYESARAALGVFLHAPRIAAAGETYHYSTHGFTLLSAMMEAATGRSILELLQSEVFEPLNMSASGAFRPHQVSATTATLYDRDHGRAQIIEAPLDQSYSWAGAGLLSTPSDLVRMTRAYWDGKLGKQTVELALAEQVSNDGTPTGVGFGWRIGRDWQGRRIAHHEGAMTAARSALLMFPDDQRAIAIQSSITWTSSIDVTAELLAEALFDSAPIARPRRVSGAYVGEFAGQPASGTWSIEAGAGYISTPAPFRRRLAAMGLSAAVLPIQAIRDDVYALVTPWGLYRLVFQQGAAGPSARVVVGASKWTLQAAP